MSENKQSQPAAGQSHIESFGAVERRTAAETSAMAMAEYSKAAVQARFTMALHRPRDIRRTRDILLAECRRPLFADDAEYELEYGKERVRGPSIRLAEAAARAMTNIYTETQAVYDDDAKRIVRVSATDLETNTAYSRDVTVSKTVERSRAIDGREVLGTRKNSRGYTTYTLRATDDEIVGKEAALVSKAMRQNLLRLIPGDLLAEALEVCSETVRAEAQSDLPGARTRMAAAFKALGVPATQLADYMGKAVADATADDLARMKKLYASLKDGEQTWAEVYGAVKAERTAEVADDKARKQTLAERMAAKAQAAAAEVELESQAEGVAETYAATELEDHHHE